MKIRLALLALFTAVLTLVGTSSAHAAPGQIRLGVYSTSAYCVQVQFMDMRFGSTYIKRVCPGENRGEGAATGDFYSEPRQMWLPAGQCIKWQANSGSPVVTSSGGISSGRWLWTHPGDGYTMTWQTLVHNHWNC